MGAERRQSEFTLMPYEGRWRLYFEHVSERQTQVSVMEVGNKPKKNLLELRVQGFPPHCGHSSIHLWQTPKEEWPPKTYIWVGDSSVGVSQNPLLVPVYQCGSCKCFWSFRSYKSPWRQGPSTPPRCTQAPWKTSRPCHRSMTTSPTWITSITLVPADGTRGVLSHCVFSLTGPSALISPRECWLSLGTHSLGSQGNLGGPLGDPLGGTHSSWPTHL